MVMFHVSAGVSAKQGTCSPKVSQATFSSLSLFLSRIHTHIWMERLQVYISEEIAGIYIYMYVMCVCERERERESE